MSEVRIAARGSRGLLVITILLAFVVVGAVVFLAVYFSQDDDDDDVVSSNVVQTEMGVIEGHMVQAPQGVEVVEFLGIPFAEPPVGERRYADPVPISSLPSDPYVANEFGASCIQSPDETFGDFKGSDMWNPKNEQSEDCLYLNVWVPKTETEEKKQVVVWIFGSAYYYGGTSLWIYDGKTLAAETDMIVVSLSYRLGSFGFLSTGDGKVKGNFGLMDVVLALEWVNDNIETFGGSTEGITVFGESSGASIAVFLMMSDLSNDLFSRVWLESGSADAHWSWMSPSQAQNRSDVLLSNVNCTSVSDVLECLRDLDPYTILWNEWIDSRFMVFNWAPTIDGTFLDDDPHTILRERELPRKDVVFGTNKNEGTFWILYSVPGLSKDTPSLLNYTQFLDGVDIIDWDLDQADKQLVIDLYTPEDITDGEANRDALDGVAGDRSFTCVTKDVGRIFAEAGMDTYSYYLTHRASNEVWPEWMGVIHAAEIQYLFGMPLNSSQGYTNAEVEFSKTIMRYLASFARTGDPNGKDLPTWPEYDPSSLDDTVLEWREAPDQFVPIVDNIKTEECQLWNELNKKHFDNV